MYHYSCINFFLLGTVQTMNYISLFFLIKKQNTRRTINFISNLLDFLEDDKYYDTTRILIKKIVIFFEIDTSFYFAYHLNVKNY
jgi:hypothetical protein